MVDAEITKFAVLSDPRPCFDAIRWSFLVADDSNMQPSTFLQRFMSIIETTDQAEAGSIAFIDGFLDALHSLLSIVVPETFPASWFPTVWTSYCDALCSEAYWLSPYELLLLAMLRDDSLCIFEHVGNHLRLIASHWNAISPPTCVKIERRNVAGNYRSHFERLRFVDRIATHADLHQNDAMDDPCDGEDDKSPPAAGVGTSKSSKCASPPDPALLPKGPIADAVPTSANLGSANSVSQPSANAVPKASGGNPAMHLPGTLPAESDNPVASDAASDASDASSHASQIGESSSSSSNPRSDDEDIFADTFPAEYAKDHEYFASTESKWHFAEIELAQHLRSNLLLPLSPELDSAGAVYTDVDTPVRLPRWHCPFQSCNGCDDNSCSKINSECGWWQHIWLDNAHRKVLEGIISTHGLPIHNCSIRETAFSILMSAMTAKERQTIPLVGAAVDRRVLVHLGEILQDDRIQTLMCFVCGCKHVRMSGFNKYGEPFEKGDISFRDSFSKFLDIMLHGEGDREEIYDRTWDYNMSWKKFRTNYGSAVDSDPTLQEGSWEWKRKTLRHGLGLSDSVFDSLLYVFTAIELLWYRCGVSCGAHNCNDANLCRCNRYNCHELMYSTLR